MEPSHESDVPHVQSSSSGVHSGEPGSARTVRRLLRPLEIAEDALHYAVAVALLGVGVIVLWRSVADGFSGSRDLLSEIVPSVINSLLFVVIVLELLGTVTAHFKRGGFQLRPFLIIGIISAVRHILTVGAKSSLGKGIPNDEFTRVMVEFGVNVGIIVALVIALAIITRTNADRQPSP